MRPEWAILDLTENETPVLPFFNDLGSWMGNMDKKTPIALDEVGDLLRAVEEGLSGLILLCSNLPDGPVEALEPIHWIALLSPTRDRIRQARGLLRRPGRDAGDTSEPDQTRPAIRSPRAPRE